MKVKRPDGKSTNMLEKGLLAEAADYIKDELCKIVQDSPIKVSESHKELIMTSRVRGD